jgi:putative protein-disulfide isomerase
MAALFFLHPRQHSTDSRNRLKAIPAFFISEVLEQDGQFTLIDIGPWLGKPEAFARLGESVGTASPALITSRH